MGNDLRYFRRCLWLSTGGFVDPDKPNHLQKGLRKFFYGLKQAHVRVDTPMVESPKLDEDKEEMLSKHIDIRFHFIKEHVENGVIELYFVNRNINWRTSSLKLLAEKELNFFSNNWDAEFYAGYFENNGDEVDEIVVIALDDALVAPADRLKIGKCNLRLSSDVTSKEATLQVVYDVVILRICPKVGNKKFVEPPLEKEILIFLASLGHSGDIRKITDVNVNKTAFNPGDHLLLSSTNVSFWDVVGVGDYYWGSACNLICSEDDISWKSSDDDQDDEQAQDDEDAGKNDVNETTQDDEDDDDHDDDEKVQDDDEHDDDEKVQDDDEHDVDETVQEDDDEELTESDDDGDDFVHPKLTTHDDDIIHEEETDEDDSRISSSDDEDSDNEDEGTNVEGAKLMKG
ncbi:hypothetical protein Tco_1318951 [Tanacetum coccineum]